MKQSKLRYIYIYKDNEINRLYSRLLDERAIKLHQHHGLDDTGIVTPVHLNFKLTSETDCLKLLEVRGKALTYNCFY